MKKGTFYSRILIGLTCGVALLLLSACSAKKATTDEELEMGEGSMGDPGGVEATLDSSECPNMLEEYLEGAEVQVETAAQEAEVVQALNDLGSLSADDLKGRRYSGKDIQSFLYGHLVPDRDYLDYIQKGCCRVGTDPCFYDLVGTDRVQTLAKRLAEGVQTLK